MEWRIACYAPSHATLCCSLIIYHSSLITSSPPMHDFLALETPEQIEVTYRIARLGSRFIAALWDSLAIALLQLALVVVGAVLTEALQQAGAVASNGGIALMVLLGFLLFWGYYVLFEVIGNGQTPGKRLAGIRTVRQDGYPIGFGESAIRNIVRIVDFLPVAYGIGVVTMFVDNRSRRLGDFAAGTLVIHDQHALAPKSLRPTPTVDEALLLPALPHLARLTPEEVEAARRFLQRRDTLSNAGVLAAFLASHFRQRLELDSTLTDLDLIQRVVAQT